MLVLFTLAVVTVTSYIYITISFLIYYSSYIIMYFIEELRKSLAIAIAIA